MWGGGEEGGRMGGMRGGIKFKPTSLGETYTGMPLECGSFYHETELEFLKSLWGLGTEEE